MSHPVVLHVYDLSMGMARGLSRSFLGVEIELIPHTGVVVHGKEYFYGGGIQALPPREVVSMFGISPVQTLDMGTTPKSEMEIREFVRRVRSSYTPESYNLFRHNCNNFSDDFVKFLTGHGIPQRILDIPGLVLRTPMGGMIEGMMNSMQANMAGRLGVTDPFSALAAERIAEGELPSSAADVLTPAGSTAATPLPDTAAAAAAAATSSSAPATTISPEIQSRLDHPQWILFAEQSNQAAFLRRLQKIQSGFPTESPHRFSDAEIHTIEQLIQQFGVSGVGAVEVSEELLRVGVHALTRAYRTWPSNTAHFPVLGLLRPWVLRSEALVRYLCTQRGTTAGSGGGSGSSTGGSSGAAADRDPSSISSSESGGLLWDVLETCTQADMYGGPEMFTSNVTALTILANVLTTPTSRASWCSVGSQVESRIVDIAVREMRNARPEIARIAAAVAHNLALSSTTSSGSSGGSAGGSSAELNDVGIQLLCGCLEGIDALPVDYDAIALHHRLLASARLIQGGGAVVIELVTSLGLQDGLTALASQSTRGMNERQLAVAIGRLLAAS